MSENKYKVREGNETSNCPTKREYRPPELIPLDVVEDATKGGLLFGDDILILGDS